MHQHEKINYIELPCQDIERTKAFFSAVFGWVFTDYGPDYTAFSAAEAGIDGGFTLAPACRQSIQGCALVVFYSRDLATTQSSIQQAGGCIIQETFSFPGGQRFHFSDPNGNEYAVWSDASAG
ncbi:MAG: VOC family protein [Pseudomonadota bacterium]